MLKLARGEGTDHPVLGRLFQAQRINQLHGGPVIAAWQVDELPDDWITSLAAYSDGYIDIQNAEKKLQKNREQWLNGHPNYRSN